METKDTSGKGSGSDALEGQNDAQKQALTELRSMSKDELLRIIFERDVVKLASNEHAKYRVERPE